MKFDEFYIEDNRVMCRLIPSEEELRQSEALEHSTPCEGNLDLDALKRYELNALKRLRRDICAIETRSLVASAQKAWLVAEITKILTHMDE